MLKILLVEDDERIRDVFTRFLIAKGHRVWGASNGQDALAEVARQTFDLVIMDVKLPKLGGLAAFEQMRTIGSRAKVVFLTGFRMNDELERLVKAGAAECLHKPLLFRDLELVLDRIAHEPPSAPRPGDGK